MARGKPTRKPGTKADHKPRQAKALARRPDLGAEVDGWLLRLPPDQRALVQALRQAVRAAAPAARESIKWGMPVYEHHGLLCYLRPGRDHVSLGFYDQGVQLDDPQGLLEGSGKGMRHLKIRSLDQVPTAHVDGWVKRALALNKARA